MGFRYRAAKALAFGLALATLPSSAPAAPLAFDCDAPASISSAVSNLAQTTPAISGVITPKRSRQGRILPAVGAQIDAPDGKSTAGFLLTLPSPDAQEMDITLIVERGSEKKSDKVGTVGVDTPIPFRIFVDEAGVATIFIHDKSWSSPFLRLIGGKEVVFCTTGQFEFSELRFSD